MIEPCTFESYTRRGWSAFDATLAVAWFEGGERRLLEQLVTQLRAQTPGPAAPAPYFESVNEGARS